MICTPDPVLLGW